MNKLFETVVAWVIIFALYFLIPVGEKFARYQNAILAKTRSWPFSVSAIIITLITILTYNITLIFWKSITGQETGKAVLSGIILTFLIINLLLSLMGMMGRMRTRLIEFVENI